MTYTVYVDDNFHPGDEEERYTLGDFVTLDAAMTACKHLVDTFLLDRYQPGITAKELYSAYTAFGEDPFITGEGEQHAFSAWGYAMERCEDICREVASPDATLPPLSNAQLDALLAFLPIFTDPAFKAGEWVTQDGEFPWVRYHPEVDHFFHVFFEHGNEFPAFDYTQDVDVRRLREHPEAIDTADLWSLRKLLFAYWRGERFCDGLILSAFHNGTIVRILQRMAALR